MRPLYPGEWDTEIIGEWERGAGLCQRCGRDFCGDHLEYGFCRECWRAMEAEADEDEDYFPF